MSVQIRNTYRCSPDVLQPALLPGRSDVRCLSGPVRGTGLQLRMRRCAKHIGSAARMVEDRVWRVLPAVAAGQPPLRRACDLGLRHHARAARLAVAAGCGGRGRGIGRCGDRYGRALRRRAADAGARAIPGRAPDAGAHRHDHRVQRPQKSRGRTGTKAPEAAAGAPAGRISRQSASARGDSSELSCERTGVTLAMPSAPGVMTARM